jgi:hypothetical protein
MPKKGSCRNTVGDVGDMFGLGYRSKRMVSQYKQTVDPHTAAAIKKLCPGVASYMPSHLIDLLEDIRSGERSGFIAPALDVMGGVDGPGGSIMLSRDLGNASHYDSSDKSCSFSIWAEKIVGQARNWYFVLPNLSINGSRGVVVKLRHGVGIQWDGRIIRHCSSVTDVGPGNHVFGCMFGSCRD